MVPTDKSSQLLMFGDPHLPRAAASGDAHRLDKKREFHRSGGRTDGSRHANRNEVATLQMCVLGSGSGGNSTVVRLGNAAWLIDAGFGPLTSRRRLKMANVQLTDLQGVYLTHLDRDHFRPNWLPLLVKHKIRLYVHRWHVRDLDRLDGVNELRCAGLLCPFDVVPFELPIGGIRVTPLSLAHDLKGTIGFRVDSQAGSLGYATDLGHVPAALIESFGGVDLLALESNYDPQMQQASSRPLLVKRRIMSMAGHLSNQQAFEAVQRILDRSPNGFPHHIVLLHRSAQCNRKNIVRQLFSQDPRLIGRITLAEQRHRTRWLTTRQTSPLIPSQMNLRF